jgi:hypothetical protein
MGRTGEDRFAFMVGRKARRREFESRCGYPSWERSQSARAAAAAIALRDADGRCDHYASRSNQACRQRSSFIRFRSASLKRDVEWIHCGALIISDPGSRRIQFLGSRFCSLLASRVRGTLCEERTCSAVPISPPPCLFPPCRDGCPRTGRVDRLREGPATSLVARACQQSRRSRRLALGGR